MESKAFYLHFVAASLLLISSVAAQDPMSNNQAQRSEIRETGAVGNAESSDPLSGRDFEGTMTLDQMGKIIKRIDEKALNPKTGLWRFSVENRTVVVLSDVKHNRMKILVPIGDVEDLTKDDLRRLMRANFDTALDGRYAIAESVLWACYIHPLRELHDRQFISAIGQTVNLAITFGSTYSSGGLVGQEDGGQGASLRQLIVDLLKKGLPI